MLKYVGAIEFFRGSTSKCKINHSPFIIGRSPSADLPLTNLNISRQHCSFIRTGGRNVWQIECLSVNGLNVDGQPLLQGEKKLLTDDALISMGENVHFLFSPNLRGSCAHERSIEIVCVVDLPPEKLVECDSSSKEQSTVLTEADIEYLQQDLPEPAIPAADRKQQIEEPVLVSESAKAQKEAPGGSQAHDLTREQVNVMLQRLSDLQKQVDTGDKQNQELSEALNLQTEELVKVQAETDEFSIELAKSVNEVEKLQELLREEKIKTVATEKHKISLEEEISNSRDKVLEAEGRANLLIQELSLVKQQLEQAEADLTGEKERNSLLLMEVAAQQAVISVKDDENVTLKADLKAATLATEAEITNLSKDVTKYRINWTESVKQNTACSQKYDKLSEDFDTLTLKYKKQTKDLTEEVNAARETALAEQMRTFEEFLESDLQCAICFELVIASTALNCGHTFCNKCVLDWHGRSPNCPTCRVQITSMQKCKMLDSFIARAAGKLGPDFRVRRGEATGNRGTDSQGQPQRKRRVLSTLVRGHQINFNLPGPEPVPEAQFFVDLT